MYYEEMIADGVLYYRYGRNDEWIECDYGNLLSKLKSERTFRKMDDEKHQSENQRMKDALENILGMVEGSQTIDNLDLKIFEDGDDLVREDMSEQSPIDLVDDLFSVYYLVCEIAKMAKLGLYGGNNEKPTTD